MSHGACLSGHEPWTGARRAVGRGHRSRRCYAGRVSPEVHRLAALFEEVLQALAEVPLAELVGGRALPEPSAALVRHLLAHRATLSAWLRTPGCAEALCVRLAKWLWSRNQYVRLDRAALTAACGRAANEVAEGLAAGEADEKDMSERLVRAGQELQARVAALVRAGGGGKAEVVCSEYAVTLQRDALGLGDEPLAPPILDVGCGSSAGFVRALRAEGLAATGLDREAPEDVALVGDWLTFPFGQDRWGTIVSHQAFSLHFIHHHLAQGAEAYAYARVYMAILRSLKPGGRLVYVPGLPFVEAMLPANTYRCTRVPLPEAMVSEAVHALERAAGFELAYAAHVERLV